MAWHGKIRIGPALDFFFCLVCVLYRTPSDIIIIIVMITIDGAVVLQIVRMTAHHHHHATLHQPQ